MKFTALPLIATGAAALVLPSSFDHDDQRAVPHHSHLSPLSQDASPPSWWDTIVPSAESIQQSVDGAFDALNAGIDNVLDTVEGIQEQVKDDLNTLAESQGSGRHDFPDKTIYELIKLSNYTKIFAKLVDEHPKVVDLLNSTSSTNYTLFVPIDAAFKDIPEDHEKPSKEFIESFLQYSIGVGEYRARRILGTNTIPTVLEEKLLGDEPQRLRTGVGLTGVNINFYSRVVAADIGAKNGVIHGIRSLIGPPPMIGRILTLFPSEFSTLLLAYEKTDFVKFIHGVKMTGSTVFAPSNRAFANLGPKVNAFLFNTDKGLKYLKALLKYHISPDATLYSDAFYDNTGKDDYEALEREHFDLKTLLGEARVGVDKASFAGFTSIKVNGFSNVVIRDAPGKNGVIHVIDKVLIPPRKGHEEEDTTFTGDMEPEEFMRRLNEYVEDDASGGEFEL